MLLYHGSNVEVSNPKISDCIPYILQFYDNEVSLLISNKYGYPIMDSYRKFLSSKTYQMPSKSGTLATTDDIPIKTAELVGTTLKITLS